MKKSFGKNSHASNKIFRDSATNLFQSFFHYFNNLEFLFHSFFQKEVSTKKLKNFHSFSSFYQILLAISIISFFYVTPVFSKLSHVDGVLNKNKYHYSNGKATFDEIDDHKQKKASKPIKQKSIETNPDLTEVTSEKNLHQENDFDKQNVNNFNKNSRNRNQNGNIETLSSSTQKSQDIVSNGFSNKEKDDNNFHRNIVNDEKIKQNMNKNDIRNYDGNDNEVFANAKSTNFQSYQANDAAKYQPTPGPFVNQMVRKEVEFNYGVNYYALTASADSRFLIRYAPYFKVGTPWPMPKKYNTTHLVFTVDPNLEVLTHLPMSQQNKANDAKDFDNDSKNNDINRKNKNKIHERNDFDKDCSVLKESISRMKTLVFGGHWDPEMGLVDRDDDEDNFGDAADNWDWNGGKARIKTLFEKTEGVVLNRMDIYLEKPCEYYPHLNMDESYVLKVTKDGISLRGSEVWGILRGLETFNQLVYRLEGNRKLFFVNRTSIRDVPRFKHRGVLLDTSRHYLDLSTILENLEIMAQNKLNVFHWHIVDDQSFPFKSTTFPNLSNYGAYNARTHIYTHEDIALVIEEARVRGIRIIPEFDTPGHTFSWGFGQKNLLTPCYDYYGVFNGLFGPINPILKKTYHFLQDFFKEVMSVFKDKYIHFGGDEVPFDCWLSNVQIKNFMAKNMIDDIKQLLSFYTRQLLQMIKMNSKSLSRPTSSIVWQEMFDNDIELPLDTIIQVWSGDSYDLQRVMRSGYGALFSTCWYLDYIQYGQDWDKYYNCEHLANMDIKNETLFLGGEVCLWSEYADDANILTRLWPRASAAAERLWSSKNLYSSNKAAPRIEEHRCRMLNRGLQVGVLSGPSHCPRFRKKYKGKHDKNNNNAKDGVNLSIEKAYEKVVKNVDGVSARKSKKPLRSANDFPFVFSNDNRADEKEGGLGWMFLYLCVSVMSGILLLFILKKVLKLPMRTYRILLVFIIVVVLTLIALQPSASHKRQVSV